MTKPIPWEVNLGDLKEPPYPKGTLIDVVRRDGTRQDGIPCGIKNADTATYYSFMEIVSAFPLPGDILLYRRHDPSDPAPKVKARKVLADKGTKVPRGGYAPFDKADHSAATPEIIVRDGSSIGKTGCNVKPDGDDWIEHDGKGCPLPVGTRVKFQSRDGKILPTTLRDDNMESFWVHSASRFPEWDIMRYRIVKPADQPEADRAPTATEHVSAVQTEPEDGDAFRPVVWIALAVIVAAIGFLLGRYIPPHDDSMEQVAALLSDCQRENGRECVLNPVPVAKVGGGE